MTPTTTVESHLSVALARSTSLSGPSALRATWNRHLLRRRRHPKQVHHPHRRTPLGTRRGESKGCRRSKVVSAPAGRRSTRCSPCTRSFCADATAESPPSCTSLTSRRRSTRYGTMASGTRCTCRVSKGARSRYYSRCTATSDRACSLTANRRSTSGPIREFAKVARCPLSYYLSLSSRWCVASSRPAWASSWTPS